MRAAAEGTVPPAPQAPPEAVLQNVAAVGAGVLCNDVAWPKGAAGYEKDVAESRAKYPLTAGMPRNAMLCAAWPYPPREAPVRITDRGPSNVLLVQNERDVNTPLAGALRMREALGRRAVMVTVDSTGHDSYLANGNACGDATVSASWRPDSGRVRTSTATETSAATDPRPASPGPTRRRRSRVGPGPALPACP